MFNNNNSLIFLIFLIILTNSSTFTTKCGVILYARTGIISVPSNEICDWRIVRPPDERITLNVTTLKIQKTQGCKLGYVEVQDGVLPNSPSLRKFCGNDTPFPVSSTTNGMLITYFAKTGKFRANYEAICGEDFYISNETLLNSPNYPEKYPDDKKCIWKITTPEKSQAVLKFQSFDLENHAHCVHDYLEVRDGFTKTSNLVGVYCGNTPPPDIISGTNLLLVTFESDATVQGSGFSAILTYTSQNLCAGTTHGCAHTCINMTYGYKCACADGYVLASNGKDCEIDCCKFFNATAGTVTSPNFPGLYPSNLTCVYEIAEPPPDKIIKLVFTYFNLERCNFDRLEIFEVFGGYLKPYGLYCGSKRPKPIVTKGGVKLSFTSDNSLARNGFVIDFVVDFDRCVVNNGNCRHGCLNTAESTECVCYGHKSILRNNGTVCQDGCYYEISSNSGVITSPNFPQTYPNSTNCQWLLITTPGHRVTVSFTKFSTELSLICTYDSVSFYDGFSTENRILGRFCGSTLPPRINSSNNELLMTFESDSSDTYGGFNALYSSLCGGVYTANDIDHYIYSHQNFGVSAYNNNMNCEWTVKSPEGYHTSISFSTFHLEHRFVNCTDFVEIFAGTNSSASFVGRFCGKDIPADLIGPEYFIRFRTDYSMVYEGFSMRYRAVAKIKS